MPTNHNIYQYFVIGQGFLLDKMYAAVDGKPTKIDPDWPIAEVFIYESDYDDECCGIK